MLPKIGREIGELEAEAKAWFTKGEYQRSLKTWSRMGVMAECPDLSVEIVWKQNIGIKTKILLDKGFFLINFVRNLVFVVGLEF